MDDKNDSNKKTYVSKVDNNIFYYGSITYEGANQFQKLIYKYMNDCKNNSDDKDNSKDNGKKDICDELNIHITSRGGNVSSGIAMMNTIEEVNNDKDIDIRTKCIAKGFVGSAATYSMFSCHERFARANTLFQLHPPSKSHISGQTEDLQTIAENITMTHNNILNIYYRKTNNRTVDNYTNIENVYKNNKYSDTYEIYKLGLIDNY